MHVGVPEKRLDRFWGLPSLYEKRRQRATEIVEAESYGFPLFEHSRCDCCWPEVILNEHVCDPRLLALQRETGEYPVQFTGVGSGPVPRARVTGENRVKRYCRLGSSALGQAHFAGSPSAPKPARTRHGQAAFYPTWDMRRLWRTGAMSV